MMHSNLMTTKEVALAFNVRPVTVLRWAKSGKLHPVRTPGGRPRYLRSEIEELLDQ